VSDGGRPGAAAILLMLAAMSLIPAGDSAAKALMTGHGVAPLFTAWARFALGSVVVGLWLLARGGVPGRGVLGDRRMWLRALLLVAGIASIQVALRSEPIANVFGAFFTGPLLSFALSALLLRERVSPARAVLLLLAFAGVLLVVRPGFGMTPGLAWAALAGLFYGAFLTASRWLAAEASAGQILFGQLAVGAVVLAPAGLATWPALSAGGWALVATSGTLSMAGNLLLIMAYARAAASRLAPFVYFQLVAATALGLLLFGEFPDAVALAGLALLAAAGAGSALTRR
jgi:drug/metabolite transporter (DMT)-like permease